MQYAAILALAFAAVVAPSLAQQPGGAGSMPACAEDLCASVQAEMQGMAGGQGGQGGQTAADVQKMCPALKKVLDCYKRIDTKCKAAGQDFAAVTQGIQSFEGQLNTMCKDQQSGSGGANAEDGNNSGDGGASGALKVTLVTFIATVVALIL